jgi:hypothetical protein
VCSSDLVRGARHFARLVQETPPGRSVSLVSNRAGSRQTLNVTPEARQTLSGFDLEGLGDNNAKDSAPATKPVNPSAPNATH